jgi:2',3'-cyclic-nucleotide 2'-phosphodiesterase (5'-nucleotidase family)
MLALLEKYKKTLKAESLDEVLTTVTGDFSKSTDGNCLLGQMAADAMKESVQTDVALLNSDAFRSNFRSGSLTREILYEIYPFDDELITMEVRGDLLKRILEKSFQRKGQGSFLQVSGLKIVPSGGQLRIMVGREPLQSRRKYKVALNDFLAEGGDGYDELRGVKSKETSSQTVRSILEKALKAKPEISAVDPEKRWN